FYPGVTDALKFASSRVYIVTTKQLKQQSTSDNVEFSIMLGKLQDKLHHTLRSLEAAR
ncbi:hypothetical protein A2U01_0018460, partial [Trifolium medium]|nr:hypothetical protein [Trifolium medium]